jgi:predicted ArsR family transcriptional regulator
LIDNSKNLLGLEIRKDISLNPRSPRVTEIVLLEYNCPVIHIAEKHWEACSTETELFEKLLGVNIETTYRAAKGD